MAHRKTAVLSHSGRLAVLGAVVNDHPTLPRSERDALRAIVHNCVAHGPRSQAVTRDRLLGRIAALGALDPRRAALLRADFDRISWSS